MRQIIFAAVSAVAVTVFADEPPVSKATTNRVHRSTFEQRLRATGGIVVKPGSGKGVIAVVDAQRLVPEKTVRGALRSVYRSLRLNVEYRKGEQSGRPTEDSVKGIGANAAIFVVDDATSPTTVLLAPEEMWAVVNVHALGKDSPAPEMLAERTGKEITRAFGWLCGAANSNMKGSVMGPMPTFERMDKVLLNDYPFDLYQPTLNYLSAYGVQPRVELTYKRACQAGWAPAPTNDYQKAIWDEVHAMPKNPMKIEFDQKKGR